jgi:hypothetical protein
VTFALFLTFHDHQSPAPRLDHTERARVVEIVKTTPKLRRGLVFTPASTSDPYGKEEPPPQLALQLYFDRIDGLEAAAARAGHLQQLAAPAVLPSLQQARVEQQAMVARPFPVPDRLFRTPAGELPCSYLVHYPGEAKDLNLWNDFYITHHAPVMARFPGIREIEICTRLDWCGFLPWPRVNHMQRNKVVFDDAAALTNALNSPVREEMRADYRQFPSFRGGNCHYAMATFEAIGKQ